MSPEEAGHGMTAPITFCQEHVDALVELATLRERLAARDAEIVRAEESIRAVTARLERLNAVCYGKQA